MDKHAFIRSKLVEYIVEIYVKKYNFPNNRSFNYYLNLYATNKACSFTASKILLEHPKENAANFREWMDQKLGYSNDIIEKINRLPGPNLEKIVKIHPKYVENIVNCTYESAIEVININPYAIILFENIIFPIEIYEKILNADYRLICYIRPLRGPGDAARKYIDICLFALSKNVKACKYITINDEKIDKFYINYIDNKLIDDIKNIIYYISGVVNDNVIIHAISKYPSLILFINQPNEEVCIKLVKNNCSILKNILNQTDEICYEAYLSDKNALKYIDISRYFDCNTIKKLTILS